MDFELLTLKVLLRLMVMVKEMREMDFTSKKGVPYKTQWISMDYPLCGV